MRRRRLTGKEYFEFLLEIEAGVLKKDERYVESTWIEMGREDRKHLFKKGMEKGREEGLEKGRKNGHREALKVASLRKSVEEGVEESLEKAALGMLAAGMGVDDVHRAVKMPKTEVERLRKRSREDVPARGRGAAPPPGPAKCEEGALEENERYVDFGWYVLSEEDQRAAKKEGYEAGYKESFERGYAEGRAEALKESREEGVEEGLEKAALGMLAAGMGAGDVHRAVKMPRARVERLRGRATALKESREEGLEKAALGMLAAGEGVEKVRGCTGLPRSRIRRLSQRSPARAAGT